MENYTAWNLETARKSSLNLGTIRAKATLKVEGRVKLIENVTAVDALVTSERIAEPRFISMEDLRNPHPKEKVLEVARKKNQKHRKMCHRRPWIWGLLMCCQTTVTPQKMTSTMTNLHKKPQKLCHRCHLLPRSGRQGLPIIQVHCGKFQKPRNGDCRDEESPFFDRWDSDVLQHEDPWARNAPKSLPNVKKKSALSELPCLFCVSEVGCVRTYANESSSVRHLQ